jgi:hypothetical protein
MKEADSHCFENWAHAMPPKMHGWWWQQLTGMQNAHSTITGAASQSKHHIHLHPIKTDDTINKPKLNLSIPASIADMAAGLLYTA